MGEDVTRKVHREGKGFYDPPYLQVVLTWNIGMCHSCVGAPAVKHRTLHGVNMTYSEIPALRNENAVVT